MKNIKWGWYDDGSRAGRGQRLTCSVYVIFMNIQKCRYDISYRYNNTKTKLYELISIHLSLDMNIFDLLFLVMILNNTWYRDLKAKGDITGHLERWRGWDRYIWFYICSLLPSARAPSEFGFYHMSKDKLSASFTWYFSMCNFKGACHSKSYPYVQVRGV